MSRLERAFSKYLPAAVIAVLWLGTALLSPVERPSTASLVLLLALVLPMTAWAFRDHPTLDGRRGLLATTALPIGVLLISSLLGDDPKRALLGAEPLHQGWLLWAALWVWFALVVLGSRRGDLMRVAVALVGVGTFSAGWACLEWFHVIASRDPGSGSLAYLDNSNSLAQVLVLSIFATAAVIHSRRVSNRLLVVGLWAALAVQLAAIYSTGSHAAFVGLVFGTMLFVFVHEVANERRGLKHDLALAAIFMSTGAMFALFIAASGVLGPTAIAFTNTLLSQRPELWMSATERVASSPLFGISPSTFESLTSWVPLPNGDLSYVLTYDPHGFGAYWVLSAGLLGIAAMGIAALKIALRLAFASRQSGNNPAVHWLCSGAAAVGIAMLTSWPEPVALGTLSVVVGGVIAASVNKATEPIPRRRTMFAYAVPLVAISAVSIVALVALAPGLDAEYDAMNGRWKTVVSQIQSLNRAAVQSGDPYYAEAVLDAALRSDDASFPDAQIAELIRGLDRDYSEEYSSQVDLPLMACEIIWRRGDAFSPEEGFALTQRFVTRGREADPSLEIWDFAIARSAVATQRLDAGKYITDVLSGRPTANGGNTAVEAALTGVATQTLTSAP